MNRNWDGIRIWTETYSLQEVTWTSQDSEEDATSDGDNPDERERVGIHVEKHGTLGKESIAQAVMAKDTKSMNFS